MSKQLLLEIRVFNHDESIRFAYTGRVDADLMHPADDPAITLRGVQTAIDYVLQQEKK